MVRTQDELLGELADQIANLRAMAASYDVGITSMAKAMSTVLRTPLHHTSRSSSLLAQLGVLNSTAFLDSGGEMIPGRRIWPKSPLTMIRMSPGDPQAGARIARPIADW